MTFGRIGVMTGIVTRPSSHNNAGVIAAGGSDYVFWPAAVLDGAALALGDVVTFDQVSPGVDAPTRAVNIRTGGA